MSNQLNPGFDYKSVAPPYGNNHFQIIQFRPTPASLIAIDHLYRIGFGDHLPLTRADHVQMMERGVVFGVLNEKGEPVAMRAIVFDWYDSIPLDPPYFEGHKDYAYCNHVVIVPEHRQSEVGHLIGLYTKEWLRQNFVGNARLSVAPWNLKSLGFQLKNGWVITDLALDLYGEGQHRFHGVLENVAHFKESNEGTSWLSKIKDGDVPLVDNAEYRGDSFLIKLSSEKLFYNPAQNSSNQLLQHYLNNSLYKGVALFSGREIDQSNDSFLLLTKDGTKNLTRFNGLSHMKNSRFQGIRDGILCKSDTGELHSLEYAIDHPLDCFEFDYPAPKHLDDKAPFLSHPFHDKARWCSIQAKEKSRFQAIPGITGAEVYSFDATHCLTQSIKDHASEMVATFMSMQSHLKGLVLATTGNMGASEAAAMAAIDKQTVAFIPAETARKKIEKLARFGAEVQMVDGNYDQTVIEAKAFAKANPQFIYSGEGVLRLEGNKGLAQQVVDRLGSYPDFVFLPVGDGAQYYGFLKGFQELQETGYEGWTANPVKLIGVQAAGANPIYQAFKNGKKCFEALTPHSKACGIAIGQPLYGKQILETLLKEPRRGEIVQTAEEDILPAQKEIVAQTGIYVEEASAVVWSALQEKLENKSISPTSKVVVIFTGHQENTR